MYEPSAHGTEGVTPIGPPGHKFTIDDRILQVSKDLPDEFPFNKDANDGTPLGLGTLHLTVGNGARASSASAYLAPKYLNRPNLHVVIHSTVSRVVKTGHENGKPVFRKVEFRQGVGGEHTFSVAPNSPLIAQSFPKPPRCNLSRRVGRSFCPQESLVRPISCSTPVLVLRKTWRLSVCTPWSIVLRLARTSSITFVLRLRGKSRQITKPSTISTGAPS